MDVTIPDVVIFRLPGKRVKGEVSWINEYQLCFRHAVEAASRGEDVDVALAESSETRSRCDRCTGGEPEDMRRK